MFVSKYTWWGEGSRQVPAMYFRAWATVDALHMMLRSIMSIVLVHKCQLCTSKSLVRSWQTFDLHTALHSTPHYRISTILARTFSILCSFTTPNPTQRAENAFHLFSSQPQTLLRKCAMFTLFGLISTIHGCSSILQGEALRAGSFSRLHSVSNLFDA